MAKKKDSDKKKQEPTVNPELEGYNVEIDSFGELKPSYEIDKINSFLNKNVEDKKLQERDDYEELKEGESPDEEE